MPMKTFTGLSKQDGITFFEIVVVVLLVGILMSFAIERLMQLQVVSEKVSVEQNLVAFNSAMHIEMAQRVIKSGIKSIREMENTNPVSYLSDIPYNYIGVKSEKDASLLPVESWYYDSWQNILVYKVRNIEYFETKLSGIPRIRFKIVPVYNETNSPRQKRIIRSVKVKSLDDYQWNFD